MATGCLAGVAFGLTRRDPALFFVGGALVAVSGLADGFDGVVARLHGKTSTLGDFLDHFFDRLVEVAILIGLALSPHATTTLGLGALVLVLLNAYLGTQIHASFGARDYTGLGKAQLFVALVLVSIGLGIVPDAAIRLAGHEISAIDLFMVVVSLGSVHAMAHRIRLVMRLAGDRDE